MKKLMFLAVVASATVASAVTCVTTTIKEKDPCTGEVTKTEVTGAATANKIAITLKTTALKRKTTKKPTACDDTAECIYWRTQASMKINGLLWAYSDECESCMSLDFENQKVAFWTKDAALPVDTFGIGIGIIGSKAKSTSIEAYGGIDGENFGHLEWAGFGSLATSKAKTDKCGDVTDCDVWVKSISGGVAGKLVVGDVADACGECTQMPYDCELCCNDKYEPLTYTAAYGTIKITYDAATAKKIVAATDPDDITTFVKLPASVADEIVAIEDITIEE